MLHRLTALAWLLGVVHTLGEGSDAGRAWFIAMVAIVVAPALLLMAARIRSARRRGAAETLSATPTASA